MQSLRSGSGTSRGADAHPVVEGDGDGLRGRVVGGGVADVGEQCRSGATRRPPSNSIFLVVHETRAVVGALASHAHHDEAFAAAQRRFVERLVQPVAALLEAARERGEVDAGMDCQLEATLLAGPVLHHHLMLHADITDELIEAVAARWLAAHDLGQRAFHHPRRSPGQLGPELAPARPPGSATSS